MFESQLLIGGKQRAAAGGATCERPNPATGDVASRAAAASLADADAAVQAARRVSRVGSDAARRAPPPAAQGRRRDGAPRR